MRGGRLPDEVLRAARALLLDAGNTLVFLDHRAVARVAGEVGVEVAAEALVAAEGEAKRRYEALLGAGGAHEEGWGLYFEALFDAAGAGAAAARRCLPALRAEHDRFNLWRRVPPDLPDALDRARALGLALGVVSNSEGRLAELLDRVGLGPRLAFVVDSAREGVRKPDPAIFLRALARLPGVAAHEAIYAGDLPSVDVQGARGAGMHGVLVDPRGFYAGLADVAVVASVAELVAQLEGARRA